MSLKLTSPKPLTRKEERLLLDVALKKCTALSRKYIAEWQPINKNWRVVEGCAYIRLSTETQCLVDDGSLFQQIHIVVEEMYRLSIAEKVNYKITRFYIDAGLSGQLDDRPEFIEMEKNIIKGLHAFSASKESARYSRNMVRFITFVAHNHKAGCRLIIPGFPINLNDPASVFQLNLMAAFAQYEASNTSKRIRENVFSAMLSGGKFNATHLILGLDRIEGKVGLYKPNSAELKIVEWIMQTFIKMGSYPATLIEIEKHGIKNKDGRPFKKNSLYGLLTNIKYIGKWELNKKNKDNKNPQLMPFEHYKLIELPHGCVIDRELFEKVQVMVQSLKGRKAKNTCIKKVYLLTGLLTYEKDGTSFTGSSAHGNTQRSNYYKNSKHHINLNAETLELEARKAVIDVIKNTPRLQTALVERAKASKSAAVQLQGQVEALKTKIEQLESERTKLDSRLDALISVSSETEIKMFKDEYIQTAAKIKSDIELCHQQIADIEKSKTELLEADLSTTSLVARAEKILAIIQEKNPVALKNAYRLFFNKIEVTDLDSNGKRELRFSISSQEPYSLVGNGRPSYGDDKKMAQEE